MFQVAWGPHGPHASFMKADLHLHTTASDGSLSPSAVVWGARAGGLDIVAITDHDTIAGLAEAMSAVPAGLRVVPGVELSTTLDGSEVHILGYFIDPAHPELVAHAEVAINARRARVERMLERLRKYGIHVKLEEVIACAEGSTRVLGRPHIARALHKKGFVQTPAEAFDRFIGDDGPCFLPTELATPESAIALIKRAGGVPVWAHPRIDMLDREIRRMADWGIAGLECFRPRAAPGDVSAILECAAKYGLLVSGGSDWHGSWQGRLGDFYVDAADISGLLTIGL